MITVNWLLLTQDKDSEPLALKGLATCNNVDELCTLVSKDQTVAEENIVVSDGQMNVYVATDDEYDDSFDEKNLLIPAANQISLMPSHVLVNDNYILTGRSQPKSG